MHGALVQPRAGERVACKVFDEFGLDFQSLLNLQVLDAGKRVCLCLVNHFDDFCGGEYGYAQHFPLGGSKAVSKPTRIRISVLASLV